MDTRNPCGLSVRRRLSAAVLVLSLLLGCSPRDVSRSAGYQPEYFDGAILAAPGLPDAGEVCSQDIAGSSKTWRGYCYAFEGTLFIQVVMEYPTSEWGFSCGAAVDRVVALFAVPTGAASDGLVGLDDYLAWRPAGVDARDANIPFAGATLAAARILYNAGYTDFQPGVFLVDSAGRYYPDAVDGPLASRLIQNTLLLLMQGGLSDRTDYAFLPLEKTCADQMALAPGVEIVGWLDGRAGALPPIATLPPTDTQPDPTPTEAPSFASLSGVVYPYATDCTDGFCPSCGQVDVYAVDHVTGASYHTFVDGLPCRYSIEVPAPGIYTVAALRRENQFCGTYLTQAELDRRAHGYCRICEPGQVNVFPGDTVSDLHIPLYMGPEEWPRGLTCAFIPVDTPPALVTITTGNPMCVPFDLRIGERIVTIPQHLYWDGISSNTTTFQIDPGTYKVIPCYAGTDTCFEPQTYVWEGDSRVQAIPRIAQDCPETNENSAFYLWVEKVDSCSVTVNGVTIPSLSLQGPWTWNWGDGTTGTGWFPQTHTYPGPGEYTVSVQTYMGRTVGDRIVVHVGSCR